MSELVWVPDEEQGFVAGTIETKNSDGTVSVKVNKTTVKVKAEQAEVTNPKNQDGVPDNTQLMYLKECHLLHNVRKRYESDNIYTFTAHILIALNPYKKLDIYDDSTVNKYRGRPLGSEPPHVYAIADRAYRSVVHDGSSQTVVVSGESGSGKTETCKIVMGFLASVGGRSGIGKLEKSILQANPILEAFGNAKTVRNNNSSRFGKFTKIHFNPEGHIIGASIVTYLLEKSRLLFQGNNERNYHIFYQLCAGASGEEKKELRLKAASEFSFLNQGGCVTIPGVDDSEDYKKLLEAMEVCGISQDERKSIMRTVAAVLHMGEIQFENDDSDAAHVTDQAHVDFVASLLGVDGSQLAGSMTTRTLTTGRGGKSMYTVPLTSAQAYNSKNALAKDIYGRIFRWLVVRINVSLRGKDMPDEDDEDTPEPVFIGILDIYGFEVFEENSFEQLCINYANEKLQQHFVEHVFRQEQEIYKREAIPWTDIPFEDNQDILDLLESKPKGVFAMLDEEGRVPKATDHTLLAKLHQTHDRSKRWGRPKPSRKSKITDRDGFSVNHFAGQVTYHIDGWLEKNNDVLNVDSEMVMTGSSHEFVKALFKPKEEKQPSTSRGGAKRPGKPKTVSQYFLAQLSKLMKTIGDTTPHFVRCIKPNGAQKPGKFMGSIVLEQLRCSGMLDALKLMQKGYPTRCPYQDLYDRYAPQMPPQVSKLDARNFSAAIMMALEVNKGDYALGITRVFFRAGQLAFLEELTGGLGPEKAKEIATRVTKWLTRKKWKMAIAYTIAARRLLRAYAGVLAARKFRRAVRVMVVINKAMIRTARRVKKTRCARTVQAWWRMTFLRVAFKKKRAAVMLFQKDFRRHVCRKKFNEYYEGKRIRAQIERSRKTKKKAPEPSISLTSIGMAADRGAKLGQESKVPSGHQKKASTGATQVAAVVTQKTQAMEDRLTKMEASRQESTSAVQEKLERIESALGGGGTIMSDEVFNQMLERSPMMSKLGAIEDMLISLSGGAPKPRPSRSNADEDALHEDVQYLEEELVNTKIALAQAETGRLKLQQEVQNQRKEMARNKEEIATLNDFLSAAVMEKGALLEERFSLQERTNDLQEEVTRLQEENTSLQEQVQDLDSQMTNLSRSAKEMLSLQNDKTEKLVDERRRSSVTLTQPVEVPQE